MEYPKFKVCCRCFTFNHSKYITDAMSGFTMQQTSFPFVCTIVDDASTDGEQEVIRKYVEENFDFSEGSVAYNKETDYAHITYAQHKTNKNCYFAVLFLKKNHYSQKKPKLPYLEEWRNICEYEALCEGDDYWIAQNKLEKQVNYLDNNRNCVLISHGYKSVNERTGRFEDCVFCKEIIDLGIILNKHTIIATASMVFRNSVAKEYHEFMSNKPSFDYSIKAFFSMKGDICNIPEVMSVYRYCSNASWTSNATHNDDFLVRHNLQAIETLECICKYFNNSITEEFNQAILRRKATIAMVKYDRYSLNREPLKKYYYEIPVYIRISYYIKNNFPFLYNILYKSRNYLLRNIR